MFEAEWYKKRLKEKAFKDILFGFRLDIESLFNYIYSRILKAFGWFYTYEAYTTKDDPRPRYRRVYFRL